MIQGNTQNMSILPLLKLPCERPCKKVKVEEYSKNPFPDEIVLKILTYVSDFKTLKACCLVSREWSRVSFDKSLWRLAIYNEVAFNSKNWTQYLGEKILHENIEEEISSLPIDELIEDFKNIKKIYPGRALTETLSLVRVPKSLSGGLSIKKIGELFHLFFPKNELGFKFIDREISEEFMLRTIDKSYWAVMTKEVLPGSRSIRRCFTQEESFKLINNQGFNCYQAPRLIEVIVLAFAEFLRTQKCLFRNPLRTFTISQDEIDGERFESYYGGISASGPYLAIPYQSESRGLQFGFFAIKRVQ